MHLPPSDGSSIRIIIAGHRRSFSRAIRALLSTYREFEVVAHVSTSQGVMAVTEVLRPDVVIMDISHAFRTGIRISNRIKRRFPGTGVLLLINDEGNPLEIWKADADGILDVGSGPDRIVAAVRDAATGRKREAVM